MHKSISMDIHNSDSYKNKILEFVKKTEGNIITTSEIASNLKISWNTAEKKLLELALDNKMIRIKKVGVNLWLLK